MSKFAVGALTASFIIFFGGVVSATPATKDSKDVVVRFYEMAFARHRPTEAASLYIGKTYIQHNPRVPDGPTVFASFFERFFKEHPAASSDVKRVVAEGDLVVVHSFSRLDPTDRGMAIVDIFRVDDGKIVEHWDSMQAVPEKSANKNTMF